MDYIATLDTEIFFLLNGLHAPWLDQVMFYATKTVTWIPLYGLLIYLIIKNFGNRSWIPLLCVVGCIFFTDRITSGVMKPYFERFRPTHEPMVKEKVHTVNGYKGGKFGFASSHAANAFGVALFSFLLLHNNYRWMSLLFIWAIAFGYTRIYLGVHYPGDIAVGSAIGLFFGWLMYRLNNYILHKIE